MTAAPALRPVRALHPYDLYGLHLRSTWRFPYARGDSAAQSDVTISKGPASFFDEERQRTSIPLVGGDWVQWGTLSDQSVYVRWSGLFEALIAGDGRRITGRPLGDTGPEVLHSYLLGATLSFALIRLGIEPLHSTVVVVDGVGVGLMGDCGYGKSSLAAAFLQAGYRVLTDDLLVLRRDGTTFLAEPGAPRIKLFPAMARRLLGAAASGIPMNPFTPKVIIPLGARQHTGRAVPLRALYVLAPPTTQAARVTLRRLSAHQACIELIRNTFNMAVTDGGRLERQLLLTGAVAAHVPVKRISYPRRPSMLAAARQAILADVRR